MQNKINVRDLVKETLKIKGTIDVNKKTAEDLKKLESCGVQSSVLIASILETYDLKSLIAEFENELESGNENSSLEQ